MAQGENLEPIILEDVRLLFRNFSGEADRFNAAGNRKFNIALDEENARRMAKDGWNVRWLPPREEGDPEQPVLKVVVKYGGKGRPPHVVLITSKGKTNLTEDTIGLLDWAQIINVDCKIRPWAYDIGGRQGIAAYLQSIYVTIDEDALERKYMDVPDRDQTPGNWSDELTGQEGPTE